MMSGTQKAKSHKFEKGFKFIQSSVYEASQLTTVRILHAWNMHKTNAPQALIKHTIS
jgi:hypothetical protein